MPIPRRIACVLLIVLLAFPSLALASGEQETEEAKKVNNAVELSEIIITATRTEKKLNEVPISVTLVDEEELRRNPALDVPTQLAKVPGVQIHGQTGTRRVQIRGMSGARTLILVDGVKQSELRGIDGSFYNIDPANIERIEVIKGPASVLYGSDAMGGVVNIITKKGGKANKLVNVYTGLVYDGSTDSFEPKAAVYGRKDGFYYRFSGSGVNANDRDTPEGKLWHTAFTQREYAGNMGYDWDKGSIDLSFDNYQGTSETMPSTTRNSRTVPTDPWETASLTTLGGTPKNDRTGYTAKLTLTDLSDNFKKLTVTGFYQELRRESDTLATFRNTSYANGALTAKTYNDHDSRGGSIQTEWLFGTSHRVIVGMDYDKSEFDSTGLRYATTGGVTSRDLRAGFQETLAFFAQDEWSLTKDLTATLGLRYTDIETELTKYSTNPSMRDKSSDSKLVGSLGFVYSGFENFYLRALYSQGYRDGNLLQKFMGSGTMMLPNPELDPETSDNYEIGVRYSNGNFNLDFAVFYNELTDGLSMKEVAPNVYQYINFDKVKSTGLELAIDYTIPNTRLTPYGSMTMLNYRTYNDETGFTTNHNGRAPIWGTLGLKWDKAIAGKHLFFVDGNVTMSEGAHLEEYNETTGTVRKYNYIGGFQTANISAGFEGKTDSFKYNFTLSLRNLFDQHYTPILASPMPEPGFNVVVAAGIEF